MRRARSGPVRDATERSVRMSVTLGPLLPAVPLVAAFAGFLLPLRSRSLAAGLGIAGAAGALLVAVLLALGYDQPFETSVEWVRIGDLTVTFGVRIDGPATLVALAVGVVALAVQVYSVAYLHDDDRYPPYAAQVSLFTAAMLLVVVSGDLILLLVGWEVMGICSYLLIGHDRRLPEAPAAAVKAFLVTRVGDVGFLLGIVVLGVHAGSFRIADVLASLAPDADATVTIAALLLLAGVAGKSAQFPLHTWLPDAMAGPTPISALIHAATMVAAGIYVVTRLEPVFDGRRAVPGRARGDGGDHDAARRVRRHRAGRHQAGAGLVDRLPDRLHGGRARGGRARGRAVPPAHPCRVQGAAVPRRRLGHPRRSAATRCRRWAACGAGCRPPSGA